ncbi:MAG: hypothetical protein ACI4TK_05380, partial [Agathobacter sp.]
SDISDKLTNLVDIEGTDRKTEATAKDEAAGKVQPILPETNESNVAYVAQIRYTGYTDLSEAFKESAFGDTIVMLKDFANPNLASAVKFTLKNGVTLEGNGYAIRGNSSLYMATAAGATSTVKNVLFENIHNNTVVDEDTCDYYGWENGKVGKLSAIYASGLQGTANIINCTFNNIDWDAIQATPTTGSTLNIIGNIFMHSGTEFSQLRYVHVQASSSYTKAIVNVNDNLFYKTKHLNDPEPTNIGVWYIDEDYAYLTGNYFEYDPAEKIVYTNSSVEESSFSTNAVSKLFPARSSANVDVDDLTPVAYISDVAYLNLETTPAAYDYNGATYTTLQDAIDRCPKSYFYLAKDNYDSVTISEAKSFSIYSKSYKINSSITNNGTLTFYTGTNAESAGTITNNGKLALKCNAATGCSVINNGTLEITSGSTYDLSKITNGENGKAIISGGTFTTEPQSDWIAEWYVARAQEDGTYKVEKMTIAEALEAGMVASSSSSGGTYYKSVSDSDSSSVYLQKDVEEAVSFIKGTYRLFYLNGYNFTGSIDMGNLSYVTIYGKTGSTATLTNVVGKKLSVGNYSTIANVTIQNADLKMLYVGGCGNCTVEGGSYDEVRVQNYYVKGGAEPTSVGSLTITGGTFKSDKITIVNANPPTGVDAEVVANLSEYVAEGYEVVEQTTDGQTVYVVQAKREA